MIKRRVIYGLVLAVIFAATMAASERPRAFELIGRTPTQSSHLLLVGSGVMALANNGMALRVQ